MKNSSHFWNNILIAVGTDPKTVSHLRGKSGYSHPIIALGTDEQRGRAVIISGESDARTAALAQIDIQSMFPSIRVVMARPAAINLGYFAAEIADLLGNTIIGENELKWLQENQNNLQSEMHEQHIGTSNYFAKFAVGETTTAKLPWLPVIKEAIQQLSLIGIKHGETKLFDLSKLKLHSPVDADREMGVCAIPLYDFSEDDVEVINSGADTNIIKEILLCHGIYQYFFPAPDQLALGLTEKGQHSSESLISSIATAPQEGHPFTQNEIVTPATTLANIIPELQEMGLLVEGEFGLETSERGKTLRAQVKFKPREGVINKLSKIFSIKADISLKDIFTK